MSSSFSWAPKLKVKYLGIIPSFPIPSLLQNNYDILLKNIHTQNPSKSHVSWVGRATLSKTILLPTILCYFRTLPIPFPTSYIKQLQLALNSYIWDRKMHRFKNAELLYL